MYKINRVSSHSSNKHNITITPAVKRNLFSKTGLVRDLKDYHSLLSKHSLDKLNSMKRLTKENISAFNFQHLKNKKQASNSTLQSKDDAEEREVYRNSILPKIPEYKPMHKEELESANQVNENIPKTFEDALNILKNRKVLSQEDMARVFNAIMNGDAILPENSKESNIVELKNKEKEVPILTIELTDEQKSKIKLEVLELLKLKIINDNHIDYNQIYDICNNLYSQFPKNAMIKSILMRAIDRFNRSQFYKIPDDRIKLLVELILTNLKKIYK